jgi:lipopolysaccharide transport system ATP-binding protein
MTRWAIRVEDLGKLYSASRSRSHTSLRESVAGTLRNALRSRSLEGTRGRKKGGMQGTGGQHWALRHVSFEVRRGEMLGILGSNGAGKTTLLRILSRITLPSQGRARIRGRVGMLLDVGAALHGELTGRENVHLYGAVLGMSKAETKRKLEEIVSFAGLDTFIDTPAKRYSTGMCLRLAFSVAAHLEPEILLVDDVLGFADIVFQGKCLEKLNAAADEGRTVILVSHQPDHVRRFCTRGLVLAGGRVVLSGLASEVASDYASGAGLDLEDGVRRAEEVGKEF